MSLLADFGAGFFGDLHQQQVDKDKEAAEERRMKKAQMLRDSEIAATRKAGLDLLQEERLHERLNKREGGGYNPSTGMYEWVDGTGNPGSRPATAAEKAQYEAAVAAAKGEGVLDSLNAELAKARIGAANRSNRGGGSETEDRPVTVTDAMALQIVGAMDARTLRGQQLEQFKELRGRRLTHEEIEDIRLRLAEQAAGNTTLLNAATQPGKVVFDDGSNLNRHLMRASGQLRP